MNQSFYGTPVSNTSVTDLIVATDAVLLAEPLEVMVMTVHEEAKPLRLQVS